MVQKYNSKNTSVNCKKLPVIFKKINWIAGTKNLDYGCGKFSNQVEYLDSIGVRCFRYDPFNISEAENKISLSTNNYDTITLSNVLNVIYESSVRSEIIRDCLDHLNSAGTLYITIYEGNRSGQGCETKKGCWQENRKLETYISEIKEIIPETFSVVKQKGMICISR